MSAHDDGASRGICCVFVCQAGALEVPAVLLAASLRRALGAAPELVAAIPAPDEVWGAPSAATLDLLRALDVRCVPVANALGRDFPFLNKLACFEIPSAARKRLFLDSDMLCLHGPLAEHIPGFDAPFAAKPADIQTFAPANAEPWRLAYEAVGVPPAELELPATVSRQYGLPYFNSGVIAVDTAVPLAEAWRACCQRIRERGTVPNSQWWLDQIGLAVAVRQLDLPFACLDERYNYPAHLKPLDPGAPLLLCHYHTPEVVAQEPELRALVVALCRDLPSLAALLAAHEAWAPLAQEPASGTSPATSLPDAGGQREAAPVDLVVAGIPGSGEDHLHALLRAAGCDVVAGTSALREALALPVGPTPWGIATLHRAVRADARRQGHAAPVVASLAPIPYLLRLSALRRALPRAHAAILIREPSATIAAWKTNGPPALRDADISGLLPGYRDDPELSRRQISELDHIARTANAAARRAMLWRFLADLALDHRHEAAIVTYTALTAEPAAALHALVGGAATLSPIRTLATPGALADPTDALDAGDRQAIRAICTQAAAELGL